MPMPASLELPNLRDADHGAAARKANLRPGGPGRIRGLQNKITRDLKLSIIDAAAAHGADGHGSGALTGYLLHLAANHPRAFSGLLAKLLPLQIDGAVNSVVSAVRVLTVPVDRYLSADDIAKLRPAMTLEHDGDQIEHAQGSAEDSWDNQKPS